MKFVLLIYQGTTPLPGTERWNKLSEDERKRIYAEYGELNQTPGVTPGLPLGLPKDAKTVRVTSVCAPAAAMKNGWTRTAPKTTNPKAEAASLVATHTSVELYFAPARSFDAVAHSDITVK